MYANYVERANYFCEAVQDMAAAQESHADPAVALPSFLARRGSDPGIRFVGLLLVGLVMVYSANLPLPSNNAESVFWRGMRGHPIHLLIGMAALLIMTRIPSAMLQSLSTPLFFLELHCCSWWRR